MAFPYLCCQPCCKVAGHSLLLCWFWHQSFRLLTPGLARLLQVLVVGPWGGLFVVFLGDVGQCSHVCAGVVAWGKLTAMHLQTEPYHFTVVTYLHQPSPLPPVAVFNRSSYCIFETFTDVDKLVLVHSNIFESSLYWWWCFPWKRKMWYYEILFRDLNAFSPVWMSF